MKHIIENLLKIQSLEINPTPATGTQLTSLRAAVPAPILSHYDRLRARGKKGVAVINRQVCSACHVQVPRNTVITLMNATDIQICESCGCYLCLPEHVNPASTSLKPVKPAKKSRKTAPALQPV